MVLTISIEGKSPKFRKHITSFIGLEFVSAKVRFSVPEDTKLHSFSGVETLFKDTKYSGVYTYDKQLYFRSFDGLPFIINNAKLESTCN